MCGVFGIFNNPKAAIYTFFGLYSLQHRGQESAGISVWNGQKIITYKGLGLVSEVFNEEVLQKLSGTAAIGHVRYSTTGSPVPENTQPFTINFAKKHIAIVHNGNIVNIRALRNSMEEEGHIFQTTTDTEVILHLIARNLKKGLIEAISDTMKELKGAYSVILLFENSLIAFRDPWGFRPLCLGLLEDSYVVASETCSFDLIGAQYLRDIAPGEILVINQEGIKSHFPFKDKKLNPSHCVFEFIYFARPDSYIFGKNVYMVRKALGINLYKECPLKGDFVMPFPDSGTYAAIGYAIASGISLEFGMIRNHYVGRTFIEPSPKIRDLSVKMKLNPVKELIRNRDIIVIDDSIVRGTTSKNRLNAIKEAGAQHINFLISCPPIKYPCFFGIDFPSSSELIAYNHTIEEIKNYLEIDLLYYLSLEGLKKAVGELSDKMCYACFTGKYPFKIEDEFKKDFAEK